MGDTPDQIVRCERATGSIIEVHSDALACIAARLIKVDALMDASVADPALLMLS